MDLKHMCMRTDRLHPVDIVVKGLASPFAEELLVERTADIGDALLADAEQSGDFGRDEVQLDLQTDYPLLGGKLFLVGIQFIGKVW